MATKVNKDKKPTSVATNLIGEPPATAAPWPGTPPVR